MGADQAWMRNPGRQTGTGRQWWVWGERLDEEPGEEIWDWAGLGKETGYKELGGRGRDSTGLFIPFSNWLVLNLLNWKIPKKKSFYIEEFAFCVVNASMALDLAFGILCELLQQWNQTSAGVLVLLEWLLGEDELKKDMETTTLMEDDNLFNKGEVNFWAETLTNVRQLSKHLFLLIPATHLNSPDQGEFLRLARRASDQAKLVTQLLKELPPTPEFSKTVEFTRLAIQNERISTCLKILTLLELDDDTCKNKENPEK
ncbi:unnamed protein product [Caretta caretta]